MNRPFWSPRRTSETSCESIEPLLPLYADGMATPDEMRSIEAHLPVCPDCRAALSWIQATHSALASRPIAVPPADLHSRIAQAIAASSAAPGTLGASAPFGLPLRPVRSFALRSFTRRAAYAAAASVTALGIALSYPLWHLSPHSAVNPTLTASSSTPPVKLPRAVPRVRPAPVTPSSPLVASIGPKTEPKAGPRVKAMPQETISPPQTVSPQEQVANAVPAPHPAALRVKAPAPSPAVAQGSKMASVKQVPAETRLSVIPSIVSKMPAPKISEPPLVARQDPRPLPVPVTVQPPTMTAEPPVQTASSHSDDLLGPVNAAAKAMRTVAFGKTDFVKRQASLGLVSAEQSLDSNRVHVYNAIYSGTAEK